MSFEDAAAGESFVEAGVYIARLIAIEDGNVGQYGPSMKWVWHLWHQDTQEPVLDREGSAYEFFSYSSTKMTPKSKARKWAKVLLGRDIEDGERGADIAQELIGKTALAFIEELDSGYTGIDEGGLKPYASAKRAGRKAQKPAPVPAGGPDDEEDDDDLPF